MDNLRSQEVGPRMMVLHIILREKNLTEPLGILQTACFSHLPIDTPPSTVTKRGVGVSSFLQKQSGSLFQPLESLHSLLIKQVQAIRFGKAKNDPLRSMQVPRAFLMLSILVKSKAILVPYA